MSKNIHFVYDAEGHKTGVILPIDEYEEMMEDLHLGRIARESVREPRRAFKEVVEDLLKAGEIDV
jgi:PHD/YefM family antitoxin component YafN of YafNO toxin-antitoxin module